MINVKEELYVLRAKDYEKGDRYAFYEYSSTTCEYTGKKLSVPEIEYERLKYADIFESLESVREEKLRVDPDDTLLNIVYLRGATEV